MANDVTGNPWKLDTVGTIWHGGVYIKNLVWNSPAVGNRLTLLDDRGRSIIDATAANTDPQSYGNLGWVFGLTLSALSGGTVTIFINK